MLSPIFVGYTLQLKAGLDLDELKPTFKAPSNYKTEEAINNFVAKAEEEWLKNCSRTLYTAEFASACVIDPANPNGAAEAKFAIGEWANAPSVPFFAKQAKAKAEPISVALQLKQFLLARYPEAWSDNIFRAQPNGPEALFVGFGIRTFLKVLGMECALSGNPLPLSMWYSTSDHRDVAHAIVPDGSNVASVSTPLAFFEDAGAFYDEAAGKNAVTIPDDYSPCQDASLDATISLMLAASLGLSKERSTSMILQLRQQAKPKEKRQRKRPAPAAAAAE